MPINRNLWISSVVAANYVDTILILNPSLFQVRSELVLRFKHVATMLATYNSLSATDLAFLVVFIMKKSAETL